MNIETEIIEREREFWMASADFYERWLAREVLMIFPAIGILNREQALDGIRSGNRWASVDMSEISVRRIGDSALALAYRARARKTDSASDYLAFVGSVYVEENAGWKLAFHQHTPV
ncbi:MAG TPA: DUF4440 domain-containing protein [Verrucomicrobiae bacterium]|nr:DUF4440 domain-containing protein [Verrucomicrobiae bacterium]